MEITRTANAGILLKLDGVTILLDGVCREVKPYPATPPEIKDSLLREFPDAVAFTHAHKDHYDPAFAAAYQGQTGRVIFGPEDLPGCRATMDSAIVGGLEIVPVPSRHIGGAGKTMSHASFIIQGRRCIWFMGDASPLFWKGRKDLPKPDVLIAPYAYATTPAAWAVTQSFDAGDIIILHLPEKEQDTFGFYEALENTAGFKKTLHLPSVGDIIRLS